jgi:tRNA(adenine34) deaminase
MAAPADSLHDRWMRLALEEARRGLDAGEVPIGAVVVFEDRAIGRAFNQPIGRSDPTAHAEVLAMRQASQAIANYRLTGATLYVTLEPCLMCAGAMVHARIGTLVFGALEPKTGAIVSNLQALALPHHNHHVEVVSGVLEVECRQIVQEFFRQRRAAP